MALEGMWTDSEQAMRCITMPEGWNDVVSSVAVYRTNHGATAQGRWVGDTATESIDFTYHLGLKYDHTTYTKESIEAKLNFDMHAGIEFEGVGVSGEISAGLSTTIEEDAQTVYGESFSVE